MAKRKHRGFIALLIFLALFAVLGVFELGMIALEKNSPSSQPRQTDASASAQSAVSSASAESKTLAVSSSSAVSKTEKSTLTQENKGILFEQYYEAARKRLSTMTLEEKVGQLFLFRCPADQSAAEEAVKKYAPAGYALFSEHFAQKTKDQVRQEIAGYQHASRVAMAIAVDEEGGTVVRVSGNPLLSEKKFKSPRDIYEEGGLNAVYNDTLNKSKLLLSLGINLNLAPVADVSLVPDSFMYQRSFGISGVETAKYVKIVVDAMKRAKLSSTLKHFPGYGENGDTHTQVVYDTRPYEDFVDSDFLPFKSGIETGAQCVLVSHNIVECIDAQYPASLSDKVNRVLREELGFTGIVMTDDLSMEGIKKFAADKAPVVLAFQAGNDLLLSSDMENDYQALYQAVKDGTISETQVEEHVVRILAWKYSMGIL